MDLGRWHKLMKTFQMSENDETFEALINAYSEKHRHYHNIHHLKAVLAHLDQVWDAAEAPHEIELALWFHDAIYEPFKSDNELKSAKWAQDFLTEQHRPEDEINRIHNMIMATLHIDRDGTADEELMVDIDLTILGARQDVYDEYERNIRKEYRMVPYFLYRKKRKEILAKFLERDRIYKTEFFYDLLESQARINIKNAIEAL